MRRIIFIPQALILAMAAAGPPVMAADSGAGREAQLVRLVRQDCGACHGMRLAGGLGPSLLPGDLAGKSKEGLVATVLQGRPGTPMPPWARFVNEAEARWIVERLARGFPDEH